MEVAGRGCTWSVHRRCEHPSFWWQPCSVWEIGESIDTFDLCWW
jgi:hypothetical protein